MARADATPDDARPEADVQEQAADVDPAVGEAGGPPATLPEGTGGSEADRLEQAEEVPPDDRDDR